MFGKIWDKNETVVGGVNRWNLSTKKDGGQMMGRGGCRKGTKKNPINKFAQAAENLFRRPTKRRFCGLKRFTQLGVYIRLRKPNRLSKNDHDHIHES